MKPAGIHHAAYIHDDDDFREIRRHRIDHRPLCVGQAEIAILKNLCGLFRHRVLADTEIFVLRLHNTLSVPALAGKTADRDNRSVRVSACLF